jgi:uncharacterized protein YbcI
VHQGQRQIGEQLADLFERFYNTRPAAQVTHVLPDMVVVVFRGILTEAERCLVDRGQAQGIVEIRRRFERSAARHFRGVVEQETGCQVETFIADVDLETNTAVQFFLTRAEQNMSGFEVEMERPETKRAHDERIEREEP